jgi:nucleotide-binding universal stress UspA family protein
MGYTMYDRILVAVDGSDTSLLALSHAVELAKVFGSELTLLSVIDKFKLPFSAEYGLGAQESHEGLVRGVIENLNEVTEELRKSHPDIRIDPRVEEGRPAQIIVEVAEDFDLIVMGSQGFGFIAGWFLGSVSNEVVNSCTKPLLIVKKPADPEPGLSP